MNQEHTTDIVIAGGGPVGLAMACALSDTGLQITLVDSGKEVVTPDSWQQESGKPDFDARVSALTVASKSLLNGLGAWNDIERVRVCPYVDMKVWDGEGTGSIHFSASDLHEQALGYIVENRLITAALYAQAAIREGVELLSGISIEQIELGDEDPEYSNNSRHSPVTLSLSDGSMLKASLLIGADGAHSFIREEAGFSVRQWDYGHQAIVTTVETEKPHEYTAWQRFMSSGPLAFLPLHLPGLADDEQKYCSIVWSCVTEKAEGIMALEDAPFCRRLGEAFEFRLGNILSCASRYSFPLWQRHATDYVRSQVALVGDAAHTIHPLAGQGVNLGFADVQVLSGVITDALAAGEPIASHQVLSRYQRRRKGQNLGMMAAMEGFKRLFGSEDLAVRWLRNTGLNLTDSLPLVKQRLMRQAMGL